MCKIDTWREIAAQAVAEKSAAKSALTRNRQLVIDGEAEYDAADEAQKIVQVVAETIQQEAHGKLSAVVQKALDTVFEEPYEFKIRFEQERGRTSAHLVFVRNGKEVRPMDAAGGGVIDVASFALRVASLMLSRPGKRRTMILDEPFKFVSADKRPQLCIMLEQLSEDLSIQFINVTHILELQCGNVIDLN